MRLLKEFEKNFLKNMNLFRSSFPKLFKILQQKDPEVKIELTILSENQYNLILNDRFVYPTHPKFLSYQQAEKFLKNPRKIKTLLPDDDFLIDTIFHSHLQKLREISSKYATEDDYIFDGKNMHVLIVEGILFGHHIEYLLGKIDVELLILLDITGEFIKPSLYVIDWEKIINSTKKILIFHDKDPQELAKTVLQYFLNQDKLLLLTFCYCFSMFRSEFWDKFEYYFRYYAHPLFRGWGFFDDEFVSLVHTFKNASKKIPVFKTKTLPSGGAACLVGSGPSLEEGIDWLKKHKDKLTIFSCGSAIKVLEKENIIPDFHVEIERTRNTYLALKDISKNFIKEIPIIAPTCIDPDVFSLTNYPIMFPKFNDVGGHIFERYLRFKPLAFCNPTVTNTGLALAIEMGFNEIYFLGIDLGFPDEKRHHAKNTVYYENPEIFKFDKKIEKFETEDGKVIYTIDDFLYTKKVMELLITHKISKGKKIKIYHLNPLMPIKGTIPSSLTISPNSKKRRINIEEISWKRYKFDKMKIIDSCLESSRRNLEKIKSSLDKEIKEWKEIFSVFNCYSEIITQWKEENIISATFYKGSFFHFGRHGICYSFLTQKEKLPYFFNSFKDIIFSFIQKSQENLEKFRDYVKNNRLEEIKPNIKGKRDYNAFYRL